MAHPFYPEDDLGFEKREALSFPRLRNDSQETGCAEENKNRNPTRRRIQVACNRCRKRKIKCSGDTGDGQGCTNCRSSGNTNCHFLRVNSSMLQTKISGWPYPAVNAMPSGRLGYHPKTLSSSPSVRTRPTGYDMGFESSVYGRPLVGHGINYEDDYFQSGYMVPNVPDYGMWNQKWNPTVKKELFDQGESFSQYPYMLAPTEVPVVPTVALPDGQDRTLPNPKNQVPSSVPVVPSTPETSGLPFQDFRISPWARTSRPMMTQPLPMNRCKLSQSQSQSQDMFAYLPTTTDPTPSVPSTGVGLEEEYRPEARVRGFSRDSGRLLGLSDCPDIYGYSTSEKKRNESETGSTLMNGLPYTRVRHPDNALTFNLLTDPIPEYRPPTETQRTVSPLGNTGY